MRKRIVTKSSVKLKKLGKVQKEEPLGKRILLRIEERMQTCLALRVHETDMSQSYLNYCTHTLTVIA